jgi:hypothetical protein
MSGEIWYTLDSGSALLTEAEITVNDRAMDSSKQAQLASSLKNQLLL